MLSENRCQNDSFIAEDRATRHESVLMKQYRSHKNFAPVGALDRYGLKSDPRRRSIG